MSYNCPLLRVWTPIWWFLSPFSSLTAISTLYFVERQRPNYQSYGLSSSYDMNGKRLGASSGSNQYEWINSPQKPLHTTFSVGRLKPTIKPLSKETNTRSPDEYIKTTRTWGPIAPSEAEDAEIASNAIDGSQYEAKKNESEWKLVRLRSWWVFLIKFSLF